MGKERRWSLPSRGGPTEELGRVGRGQTGTVLGLGRELRQMRRQSRMLEEEEEEEEEVSREDEEEEDEDEGEEEESEEELSEEEEDDGEDNQEIEDRVARWVKLALAKPPRDKETFLQQMGQSADESGEPWTIWKHAEAARRALCIVNPKSNLF